jgi:tetratricopeptide (TPR) repeat protein/predicted Ser/Thr protein kinase
MIEQTVSHYRILEKLGSGGMGEVYLAKDMNLGRLVALKTLPAEVSRDTERIHRFEQEARAASALNHPNILTIHDIGQSGDLHFIVSEYIKGENLHQRQKRARLSLDDTLEIALQVVEALIAAHKAGIVHRDIKPNNIMVGEDGRVKVIDFGLAKLTEQKLPLFGNENPTLEDSIFRRSTAAGEIMGTPDYMSPERLKGKGTDARSDVWSLGVCLYEMLAGRPPFAQETLNDTIAAILKDEIAPLGVDVPARLSGIVRKALQKDCNKRYQTVEDFRSELSTFKNHWEATKDFKRPGRTHLRTQTLVVRIRRYKHGVAAGFIALLAAAALSVFWYPHYEARRHVAMGREYWKQRTGDNLNKAKEHFERAIAYDPGYAQAYSDLADTYVLMEEYLGIPTRETIPQAENYAKKALAINDSLAETHASLAFIQTKLWKWDEAEKEFKRAIELNPKYPKARQWYSLYLRIVGRYDDALTQIKIASDLDPSSEIIRVNVMLAYIASGDNESAVREGGELLSRNPAFWGGRSWRGMVYLEQGRKWDAVSDLEAGVNHSQRSHTLLGNLGYGYAIAKETRKALEIIKELEELQKKGKATGQSIAKVYAGLGQKEAAFEWLEKDYDVHSGDLPHISWHPAFKSLHGDPHYNDLLRRMNLQPQTESGEETLKPPLTSLNETPDKSPEPTALAVRLQQRSLTVH